VSSDLQELDSLRLVALCAQDTQNPALWSEFVRRFTPKIRQFIRGTLRQAPGINMFPWKASAFMGGVQENDLFQSTIIRLVENGCAALKRFTGTSEDHFLAYLAVISRSVVRDFLRRRSAWKRPLLVVPSSQSDSAEKPPHLDPPSSALEVERIVLAREVQRLSERSIRSLSGESADRDRLIFRLYYYNNLSANQIAQCQGIGLSKAGVEKVLNRLKERVQAMVSADRSDAVLR